MNTPASSESSTPRYRVAAVQFNPLLGKKEQNVERLQGMHRPSRVRSAEKKTERARGEIQIEAAVDPFHDGRPPGQEDERGEEHRGENEKENAAVRVARCASGAFVHFPGAIAGIVTRDARVTGASRRVPDRCRTRDPSLDAPT